MDFPDKVSDFIKTHQLLSNGEGVLVAVSGGPDSVALLRVLYELRDQFALRVEVAHLQHGIRGEEARQDAEFVRGLAGKMGLPFHLKEVDVPRLKSTAGRGNLEALARAQRYRVLATVARAHDIGKVAVAHTQDDQAETVLMWLLRGSGTRGLGGMSPMRRLSVDNDDGAREIELVRPLLGISKAQVLGYLSEKDLSYRLDRTNEDASLLRNWIRLRLMPQLTERIDSRLPARLSHQAERIRSDQLVLEGLATEKLKEIRTGEGLDRRRFLEHEVAMQRLILRSWIEEVRGHLRGVDFDHIEELRRLIMQDKPQSRFSIPGGWELVREYERIKLERRLRNLRPLCYSYEFDPGADLKVPEARIMIRSARVYPPPNEWPATLMEAVFDGAHLPHKLVVRNFRHGDLFQPLGMAGHKKVKELFIEKRVPLSVRATLPLLATGEEILWIPGYGRSEIGKVGPQTSKIWRFTAVPF
jgi:tRNA(Ile)-lysidine synthase